MAGSPRSQRSCLGSSGDGSGHACAACTHDDNVSVNGGILGLGRVGLDLDLIVVSIQAGGGQGSGCCLLDGVGGDWVAVDTPSTAMLPVSAI